MGYVDDENKREIEIERGDISRLGSGSVFYLKSYASPTREKLRIYAFFANEINENTKVWNPSLQVMILNCIFSSFFFDSQLLKPSNKCLIIPSHCFLFSFPFDDDSFISFFQKEAFTGAYSYLSNFVLGFDKRVLQAAFQVRIGGAWKVLVCKSFSLN